VTLLAEASIQKHKEFRLALGELFGSQVLYLSPVRDAFYAEPGAKFTINIEVFDGRMHVKFRRDES
jgi:hypothetical protein